MLESKKQELDSTVKDLQAQIEDDEIRTNKMAAEASELQDKLAEMESGLLEEEGKVQKLQMEKLTIEAQLNRLAEETSTQNEVLTKVSYCINLKRYIYLIILETLSGYHN